MSAPCIPPATIRELQNPAGPGQRHSQILKLACSLTAQGFNSEAIFSQLRPNYDPDVPDNEIRAAIYWAAKRKFDNSAKVFPNSRNCGWDNAKANPQKSVSQEIEGFLKGFSCGEADIFEASPVRLPENYRDDCLFIFEFLYFPHDQINIVTQFRTINGVKGSSKANPFGKGITKFRNNWLDYCRANCAPQSDAGAWLRINPTNGEGISDGNITDFRFILLESDILPLEIQFSVLARLPLPICAILTSGGKSLHAWLKVSANCASDYRNKANKLFSSLSKLGFDSANRNPSRLSRLPGVERKIGAAHNGIQKLIYLNPFPANCRSIL